jgi:hypothetical protein
MTECLPLMPRESGFLAEFLPHPLPRDAVSGQELLIVEVIHARAARRPLTISAMIPPSSCERIRHHCKSIWNRRLEVHDQTRSDLMKKYISAIACSLTLVTMLGCATNPSAHPDQAQGSATIEGGSSVTTRSDGKIEVRMVLTNEEWEQVQTGLPPELAPSTPSSGDLSSLGRPELMGFWPKPRKYCVTVRDKRGQVLCQKTIYESPLWAWARCVGITLRKGGKSASGSMSEGVCSPENTCGF